MLFVHRGTLTMGWPGGTLDLGEGDTFTVPAGTPRRFASDDGATAFIARGPERMG